MTIPTITLNNGKSIPQLGYGVFEVPDDQTTAAVSSALEIGYRSIDTAAIYGNEAGTGRAIAQSAIPRDELFVTTKVWNTEHGYDRTRAAFEASCDTLGLEYFDLYLVHWPSPSRGQYSESWRALESLYAEGRVRSIGVSNFLPDHLQTIIGLGGTIPAVNQIELHPALQQRDAQAFNAKHKVVTQAWSPLAHGELLGDPVVVSIAERVHRTPAQVILRWHLQHARAIVSKTVTPSRMRENLDLFTFELSDREIAAITACERNGRVGPHPDSFEG